MAIAMTDEESLAERAAPRGNDSMPRSQEQTMLIGHITDFHALEPGERLGGLLDTNRLAEQAVEAMNARLSSSDVVVVVTGDLTHNGKASEMRQARTVLDKLSAPYLVLPGSHDNPANFLDTFGDKPYLASWTSNGGYSVDDFPVRFVAINTNSATADSASIAPRTCDWLDGALMAERDRPTVVLMHHPPFQCSIPVATYLKDPDVTWAATLKSVIERHDQVQLVLCGHVHRAIQTVWAGALVSVAPATCVQSEPMFHGAPQSSEKGRRVELVLEPAACQLHRWDGRAFTTYTLPTDMSYRRV
jgi:3',5'-cyclic-AMP phosphodiesterase